ncbi:MAG: hypothetical protein U9O94_02970, partial [Nanoarchaeota archaeon]|nr:hypothetical protein [Nanoarchaeota archaeon]
DYIANFGKDGKIIKDLLKIIPPDDLKKLIDKFMASDDDFIEKAGYTIGVFKAMVNKLQMKVKPTVTYS